MPGPRTNLNALLQVDPDQAVHRIQEAARIHEGKRAAMSMALGVSPPTLWRIMSRTQVAMPDGKPGTLAAWVDHLRREVLARATPQPSLFDPALPTFGTPARGR